MLKTWKSEPAVFEKHQMDNKETHEREMEWKHFFEYKVNLEYEQMSVSYLLI